MEDGLDAIGILHGVDKSSRGHGYLVQYERIVGPLRRTQITLLRSGSRRALQGMSSKERGRLWPGFRGSVMGNHCQRAPELEGRRSYYNVHVEARVPSSSLRSSAVGEKL